MLNRMKQALGLTETPQPTRAPTTAVVPILRPGRGVHVDQGGPSMGYLDRDADSARPAINAAPFLRTSDEEIRLSHRPVAAAARHLFTQSGFLQFGVELNCSWVVGGHGLEPSISVDTDALGWQPGFAKTWSRFLSARFSEWSDDARSCDSQARQKFGALQNAAVRSYLGTGDIVAVLDYGEKPHTTWKTAINLIDPTRLWTPPSPYMRNVVINDGVEFDDRGRALAYHIRPLAGHTNTIRVPTYSNAGKQLLAHCFDAEPGAIRGISPLGAAIGAITQSMNVGDAAVLASHVAAMVVGVVTSDLPSDAVARAIGGPDANPLSAMMEARTGWHEALKKQNAHLKLGHGARIAHLSTGERFDLLAGKVGFSEYERIIRLGLAEAARALGLSPEALHGLKNEASYSSLKQASVEMRSIVARRRKVLIEPFVEFALWSVAEELIADNRLPWPGRARDKLADFRMKRQFVKVEWRGPQIEDADELKSAKAAIERVKNGLSSLTDEINSSGKSAEDVMRQRAADEEMLTDLGVVLPWTSTSQKINSTRRKP